MTLALQNCEHLEVITELKFHKKICYGISVILAWIFMAAILYLYMKLKNKTRNNVNCGCTEATSIFIIYIVEYPSQIQRLQKELDFNRPICISAIAYSGLI